MEKRKNFCFLVLIVFLFFSITNSLVSIEFEKENLKVNNNENAYKQQNLVSLPPLNPSPPINIVNNSQIITYASSGIGTTLNPYIIEALNITYSGIVMLNIQNTNKALIIKNCYFSAMDYSGARGIFLNNVSNVIIENNLFEMSSTPIFIFGSSGITIQSNIIQHVTSGGIALFESNSDASIIKNNQLLLNNEIGVDLYNTTNMEIANNFVNNSYGGLYLINNNNLSISQNIVSNTFVNSFLIDHTNNSLITSNLIAYTTTGTGISLTASNNDVLNNNSIDHLAIGIDFSNSYNNSYVNSKITNCGIGINLHAGSSKNTFKNISILGTEITSYGIKVALQSNWNVFENASISNSNVLMGFYSSNNNKISKSTFQSGYGNGTEFHDSYYNVLANSTFKNYLDFDVVIDNGGYDHIIGNSFVNSRYYSVYISSGYQNLVAQNVFLATSNIGSTPAFDNGMNDVFRLNYWTNWIGPDKNNDGIVDYPYLIDGSALSYDNYPVTNISVLSAFVSGQLINTNTTTSSTTTVTSVVTSTITQPGLTVTENGSTVTTPFSDQNSNSTTLTKSSASPGFELISVIALFSIIAIGIKLRKRKNS